MRFLIAIFFFTFGLIPLSANATVLYSQTVKDTNTGGGFNANSRYIGFGDGTCSLTGSIKEVTVNFAGDDNSGSTNHYIRITNGTSNFDSETVVYNHSTTPQDVTFTFTTPVDLNGDCIPSNLMAGATPIDFSIILNRLSGDADVTIQYGSASNVDPDSFCYHGSSACGSVSDLYYILDNGITNTSTRITTVNPAHGESIATTTSTVFEVNGYINPEDFVSGMGVRIKTIPNSSYVTANQSIYDAENLFIPVTASGDFTATTTLTLAVAGQWQVESSIVKPRYSIFGFNVLEQTLNSTSTVFINGLRTYFDYVGDEIDAVIAQASSVASTSVSQLAEACGVFSGDSVFDCLFVLFVPSQGQIVSLLNTFTNNIATTFPFGYITRFLAIITNNTTTELPPLEIVWPEELTGTEYSLTLTPWDYLLGETSLLGTATTTYGDNAGQTFRDVVEDGWETFLNVVLILLIAGTLLGFKVPKFL